MHRNTADTFKGCEGKFYHNGNYCLDHPVYQQIGGSRIVRFVGGGWKCLPAIECEKSGYYVRLIDSPMPAYPVGNWHMSNGTSECSKLLKNIFKKNLVAE